jgi:type III restriction enzyme
MLTPHQSQYIAWDCILMCETKARADLGSDEVRAKASAGRKWCGHASEYSRSIGGKPWEYLLIPHDEVKDDRSLDYLRAVGTRT